MRRSWPIAVVLCAACTRVGYLPVAPVDAPPDDQQAIDAALDASTDAADADDPELRAGCAPDLAADLAADPQNGVTEQWSSTFYGNSWDYGNSVVVDSLGNITIAGQSASATLTVPPDVLENQGFYDAFLASHAADGALRWTRRFGGAGHDAFRAVAVDVQGNLYVCGWFSGAVDFGGGELTAAGSTDIVLASFDAAGVHLWSRRFGGASYDNCVDLRLDAARGRLVATGRSHGDIDLGHGAIGDPRGSNGYVATFTTSGQLVWARPLTALGSAGKSAPASTTVYAQRAAPDAQGNIYAAGIFHGDVDFGGRRAAADGQGGYLAAYDRKGALRWLKDFAHADTYQTLYGLAVTPAGRVYIAGSFHEQIDLGGGPLQTDGPRDAFVAAFDAAGHHLWSQQLAGEGMGYAAAVDPAGNPYFALAFGADTSIGGADYTTVDGELDVLLVAFDSAGNPRWSHAYGGTGTDTPQALAFDSTRGLLLVGAFAETIALPAGPATSAGAADGFLVRYTIP